MLKSFFERRFHVSESPPGWVDKLFGLDTASGVSVTPDSALTSSAVYACVKVLAEDVAGLPLLVYQRRADGGKERAEDYFLYPLLHDRPNPEMTSFELRETMMGHLVLWGNAYAEIEYNGAGRAMALWPLRPDRMRVVRELGKIIYYYRVQSSGVETRLEAERVLHVRGLSSNGIMGVSPIQEARNAIGLALATEEFGGKFFSNNARPAGVLEHPGVLGADGLTSLRASINEMHLGLDNAQRLMILEEGMKYSQIGIPPGDAQFLETRKFQTEEIARIYRVPPHMIGHLEKATFSNIEHQSIEFVTHSLRPWLVRWEQRIDRNLIPERDRVRYFAEFLVDGLLRGDTISRYQAYATARQNGWMSANDIRRYENMNPVEGGDVYLTPLNMTASRNTSGEANNRMEEGRQGRHAGLPLPGMPEREGREASKKDLAEKRLNIARSYRRVLLDAAERSFKRESQDVIGAANKFLKRNDAEGFAKWMDEYYLELPDVLERMWKPAFWGLGEAINAAAAEEVKGPIGLTPGLDECLQYHLDRQAERSVVVSKGLIETIMANSTPVGDVETLIEAVSGWVESRSPSFATWEATRIAGLMTKATYFYNDVHRLQWIQLDTNMFCSTLNGKVIDVGKSCRGTHFAPKGVEIEFDLGGRQTRNVLRPAWNVATPPLFCGCECQIVAADE